VRGQSRVALSYEARSPDEAQRESGMAMRLAAADRKPSTPTSTARCVRALIAQAHPALRRNVPRSGTSRALEVLAFDLQAPLSGGEGRTKRPRRGAGQEPGTFRRGRSPVEKPGRPSRTGRLYRPATRRGCPFFGLLFFYSGHPALRPSGRLRRSHVLLPVRGQAKKSDPASGRRSERPPRRRARSRKTNDQAKQRRPLTKSSPAHPAPDTTCPPASPQTPRTTHQYHAPDHSPGTPAANADRW